MIDISEEDKGYSLQDAMTPMIDVIFVLIAFMMLMINVPLMTMEVNLPQSAEKPREAHVEQKVIHIAMQLDNEDWFVDMLPLSDIETLTETLRAEKSANEALSVVVHSDKKVPMERLVKLFSVLQSLELNVTHLALDNSEG